MANSKVLFIDDDRNILSAFKRQLRGVLEIETACSAADGLAALQEDSYAVVVADMQMPQMNGIEFLKLVKESSPDTVRVMLTGNADLDTAINALNFGNIFRFINKPISTEDLTNVLHDSVKQHELIASERELLQKTLSGSVKVLTDLLSVTEPTLMNESIKLRELLRKIAEASGIQNTWEVDLAGMLVDVGRILLPAEMRRRVDLGEDLNSGELTIIKRLPDSVRNLIGNIPRLDNVSNIVFAAIPLVMPLAGSESNIRNSPKASQIIALARDYGRLLARGLNAEFAIARLRETRWKDSEELLTALERVVMPKKEKLEEKSLGFQVSLRDLCPGQVLLSPVETSAGKLLMAPGSLLTQTAIERIKNYAGTVGVRDPIMVDSRIPTGH